MRTHNLENWRHTHEFFQDNPHGERRTYYVLVLTLVTMVVEIAAGIWFGSMALLADGWHMATHVAAFSITLFAYRYARAHSNDGLFAFGAGKVGVLGAFASAVALLMVALLMALESSMRFIEPHEIRFNEAIIVAALGLGVNLLSALLLKDSHHHHHDHDHHHHDHNLYAAYMHVLADALTSVLAIGALLGGKYWGWNWLDPLMGLVGALIIARWGLGLVRESAPLLLDASIDPEYHKRIVETLEAQDDLEISDIHIWKVGPHDYAAMISLLTHTPQSVEHYKELLSGFEKISHLTIEVNVCRECE